ncbi:LCP family protein [Cellulomonas sp. URHB0016]
MPDGHRRPRRHAPPRHALTHSTHRVARGVALSLAGVLVFGVSAAVAVTLRMTSNMDHFDMDGLVTAASPQPTHAKDPDDPNAGAPVNILLIGSDQRDGANEAIGGADSTMASDTTIVAHISADRTRVELVSIPRDSMVRIPSCRSDGSTSKARAKAQINSAFATGWKLGGDLRTAAACTVSTVQENTGLAFDHVVIVDMAGFQQIIDTVGGVDICIPTPMKDRYTGLDIRTPGMTHLDGVVALQFARARHIVGSDGSDLTRIGNQQRLLSAVMAEVLSKNVVTDVPQLLSFLSAVTSSLTTDNDLTVQTMVGLAYSARGLGAGGITFMTIPNGPDPENGNRVVWTDEAETVWSNLVQDVPVVPTESAAADTSAVPPVPTTATDDAAAPPATTTVETEAPPAAPTVPTPAETRKAGREPFTANDVTATCA